jgi:putative transcriptional regulator
MLDLRNLFIPKNDIQEGAFLISEPMLSDPNFGRSVILVCDHDEEGTFGLVINRMTNKKLSDLEGYDVDIPIDKGGPVESNSLYLIHQVPEIENAIPLSNGLYWGGAADHVKFLLNAGLLTENNSRFMLGYSGWGPGQLKEELDSFSWLVSNEGKDILFETRPHKLWKKMVLQMGKPYKVFTNFPADPAMN